MNAPLIRILNITFIASLFFMFTALEADGKRGVRFQDTKGEEVGFYQNSYALVVGASAYHKGWPKLPGVVDDITTVSNALKERGFSVRIIRDPDHIKLKSAFNDFINNYGQENNNRLLFYFAGHGHTLRLSYGADMGYIVPVDAPDPDMDKSGFLAKALDMQQFEVYARRIQSKHALFLFDSCFSGSIFALERAIPKHISYKTARPVRQFVTSGSADETVPDKSIFRHQFLEALDGEADVNEDGYITASELGEFLFEKVVNYSRGSQHPQYGKIRDMYLDKGDFVFLSASTEALEEKDPKIRPKENTKTRAIGRDGHFIAYANTVVTDTKTGLDWVAGPDKNTSWYEAKAWVDSLTIGGGGWRMPTVGELKTLYQKGSGWRNRTPLFKTRAWYAWSGESKDASSAVLLYFFSAWSGNTPRSTSDSCRAFAVRSQGDG